MSVDIRAFFGGLLFIVIGFIGIVISIGEISINPGDAFVITFVKIMAAAVIFGTVICAMSFFEDKINNWGVNRA